MLHLSKIYNMIVTLEGDLTLLSLAFFLSSLLFKPSPIVELQHLIHKISILWRSWTNLKNQWFWLNIIWYGHFITPITIQPVSRLQINIVPIKDDGEQLCFHWRHWHSVDRLATGLEKILGLCSMFMMVTLVYNVYEEYLSQWPQWTVTSTLHSFQVSDSHFKLCCVC